MSSYVSTSVARRINNISVGYGEIPLKRDGKHRLWALPGGKHTSNKQIAFDVAKEIDRLIRKRVKHNPNVLLGMTTKT